MGLKKCMADECLLKRKTSQGTIVDCVYIDDTLCAGDNDAIEEFKDEINNHFSIKESGKIREYVGYKVKKIGKRSLILYQIDLISKIEKNLGEAVEEMQRYGIPTGNGEHIERPDENELTINKDEQKRHRSGVGMLLDLVKFFMPDISNLVRELSKVINGATPAYVKSMLRTIKFVMDTKQRVLNLDLREQEGS